MTDCQVYLVHMPFAVVTHPSIGLGLLKAGLTRAGISCHVHYANLEFAEVTGRELHGQVDKTGAHELFGEWMFSLAAFREQAPEPVAYLQRLQRERPGYQITDNLEAVVATQKTAANFIEELAQRVAAARPRILGCSSMFQQNCASLALLRRVKELAPDTVTVMGGANCEGPMGVALVRNFAWVDYAFSGEADELFPAFCRSVLGLDRSVPAEKIFGVLCRENLPECNPPRATVTRLDALATPDFDEYFEQLESTAFAKTIEPGLLLETSRGCWWGQKHHCTFCGLNGGGMSYRSKSAERILAELSELSDRYGVIGFEVVDNILDMAHLKTVLPTLADRGAPYRLFYETKSNLRRSQVELLARAGVRWIQPGIESLDDRVLKVMEKGSNAMLNVQLLRFCREFGVRVVWNFLHGFPGESSEWSREMAEKLPLLHHLHSPSGISIVRYDRFSPYHEKPEQYQIELRPNDYYQHIYPLAPDQLAEIAYFFDDREPHPRSLIDKNRLALLHAVKDWKDLWNNRVLLPLLSQREVEGGLEILDTRACARQRRIVLKGLQRELLLTLDNPHSLETLVRDLGPETENALHELVEQHLVLSMQGKYLALPVGGSLPAHADPRDFPGGYPQVEPWRRAYRPRALTTAGS